MFSKERRGTLIPTRNPKKKGANNCLEGGKKLVGDLTHVNFSSLQIKKKKKKQG